MRLVLSLCLVLFSASAAQATPITVMRFSGAITEVPQTFTDHFVSDITVGTWFVGALVMDDPQNSQRVYFDLTIGNHHITGNPTSLWRGENESYDSLFGTWPGLTGGYIDTMMLTDAYRPLRQLFVRVAGVGNSIGSPGGVTWYETGIIGTVYNVPEPSTMLMLALGSALALRRHSHRRAVNRERSRTFANKG